MSLKDKNILFCDKLDCMPLNMNVMTSCFNLRRQFIEGCISQDKSHTDASESKSFSPLKVKKEPMSTKSKSANSQAPVGDIKT